MISEECARVLAGLQLPASQNVFKGRSQAFEIRRLASLASLTLVECDAAIHRVYPMAGPLGPFIGGGDTNFVPVFDEARNARNFEGLVYFTDGKGALPKTAPFVPTAVNPLGAPGGAIVGVAETSEEIEPAPEELVACTT